MWGWHATQMVTLTWIENLLRPLAHLKPRRVREQRSVAKILGNDQIKIMIFFKHFLLQVWYPVTAAIGKISFDGPECIKQVESSALLTNNCFCEVQEIEFYWMVRVNYTEILTFYDTHNCCIWRVVVWSSAVAYSQMCYNLSLIYKVTFFFNCTFNSH